MSTVAPAGAEIAPAGAGLAAVARRGIVVLAELRRRYEPRLWRDEARAQLVRVLRGRRAGTIAGRDHDGAPARGYRSRTGEPPLWLRPGTGDAAVWGEVEVRGVYAPPWPIPAGSRVLDLGGHIGCFARWALAHWPVRAIVSVEPDPDNAKLLAINADAVGDPRWTLIRAAAATTAGTAAFAGGRGCASGLSNRGDEFVSTVDALELLGECDVAKIDIEGGEWELLEDARFAAAAPPMLVLEHHPRAELADPAAAARRHLERAGYEVLSGPAEELPGIGVLWARRAPQVSR